MLNLRKLRFLIKEITPEYTPKLYNKLHEWDRLQEWHEISLLETGHVKIGPPGGDWSLWLDEIWGHGNEPEIAPDEFETLWEKFPERREIFHGISPKQLFGIVQECYDINED